MIYVALCFPDKDELRYLTREVERCFFKRDIYAVSITSHSSNELLFHTSHCPSLDVLLCQAGQEGIQQAALVLKKRFPNLITIITGKRGSINEENLQALAPVYQLKDHKKLCSCVSHAFDLCLSDSNTFTYYKRPEYATAPLDQIKYFSSQGRRIVMVTAEDSDFFYQKLDDIEHLLNYKNCLFFRIHKSYLVNTRYILSYDKHNVTLISGEVLTISKYDYYKRVNLYFKHHQIPSQNESYIYNISQRPVYLSELQECQAQ